jgi:hypothetical protein
MRRPLLDLLFHRPPEPVRSWSTEALTARVMARTAQVGRLQLRLRRSVSALEDELAALRRAQDAAGVGRDAT